MSQRCFRNILHVYSIVKERENLRSLKTEQKVDS